MGQQKILVVDDAPASLRLVCDRLERAGYDVTGATNGEHALQAAPVLRPDLILLDVVMPGVDGFEVCRSLRAMPGFTTVPIVLLTSLEATAERVLGLDSGADEFLSKPIVAAELLARVRSLLRMKSLHDTVLRQREELSQWAATLEQRVEEEVARGERLSRLTRFFSPRLAERLVTNSGDDPLQSHRREISVLFADLRGFTAFAENAPPEDVMAMLAQFHAAVGELILELEGTLDRFTGDGMMVFFNDPDPIPDHTERAVRLGLAMQATMPKLLVRWREGGNLTGLGVGISRGVATLGGIGSRSRLDYAAIGSVVNLAARLCSEASAGEIILCKTALRALGGSIQCDELAPRSLKGFAQPVGAFRVAVPTI
jgi:adenylate cyclase